ncbi:hypothetical protein [Streptomyces sp. NPDC127033]|uniref:hypothetical protein n=1 Tax=Streptomyces sp. NPDC127033 TaxID=3347110 RepID=UPI0036610014
MTTKVITGTAITPGVPSRASVLAALRAAVLRADALTVPPRLPVADLAALNVYRNFPSSPSSSRPWTS